jgi:Calx-beta domain-containing protein
MRHRLSSDVSLRTRSRRLGMAGVIAVSLGATCFLLVGQANAVSTAPSISASDVSTPEGGPSGVDHTVSVPVTLSEASSDTVLVDYETVDGTAKDEATPDPWIEYRRAAGTLAFAPGDTSENVEIVIIGGDGYEPDQEFTVVLSNARGATIARGVATVTIVNDDAPPPPEPGQVNVLPVGGGGQCVAVKGGGGCKPLEVGQQVEIEDVLYVNPRTSRVLVQSVAGNTAFYGGKFDVSEIGGGGDKPITVLRLVGGNFKTKCGKASRATAGVSAQAKKTPVRRLWGKGKGRFRTRGRYSSGTVRGTNWVTTDFCDGTDTRVVAGIVRVYDFVTKKWILLEAGESYFAKAGKIN